MDPQTMDIGKIIGAAYIIYSALLYVLPPKKAKKIRFLDKFFAFLQNTPGGFKRK